MNDRNVGRCSVGSEQVTPSKGGGYDLVGRSCAKWKPARAKRVDDERVRKCASYVGELVQSHPSSASAVLARIRSPRRTDGAERSERESRGNESDSGSVEAAPSKKEEEEEEVAAKG